MFQKVYKEYLSVVTTMSLNDIVKGSVFNIFSRFNISKKVAPLILGTSLALGAYGCSDEESEGPIVTSFVDGSSSQDGSTIQPTDSSSFDINSYDSVDVADLVTPDTYTVDVGTDTGTCVEKRFYLDKDNDNFGDSDVFIDSCEAFGKYNTFNAGDCDDSDASINPGAKELCNGIDDNCNTKIDEIYKVGETCSDGVGECKNTSKYVCKTEHDVECPAIQKAPTTEYCDGLDNNCDGTTDEYFKLGDACTVGYGGCAVTGKTICAPSKLEVICDALPKKGSPEVCDNFDNDCNGKIDDGLSQPCNGPCGGGKEYCHEGNWKDCDAPQPQPEVCDNFDNDCDGQIDEGFNSGKECYNGKGECKTSGKYVCSGDEKKVICDAVPPKGNVEICDGKDNDCDGKVDEDFTPGYKCTVGVGECQTKGIYICSDDKKSSVCDAKPKSPTQELCDNSDNNCNGKVDEYFNIGEDCSSGQGECQVVGKYICSSDKKSTVCDALPKKSQNEICDGKDNNCDGKIDENFKLNEKCYVGEGECKTEGKTVCSANKLETICEAISGKSVKETCDYLDNDCDGKTDEDFNSGKECYTGVGECKTVGKFVCATNKLETICDAVAKEPSKEICDNKDNDCDNKVDEDCLNCWDKTFGDGSYEQAKSIQQTKDLGYVVTGFSLSNGSTHANVTVIRLDKNGNLVWEKPFGGNGDDRANAVKQDKDLGFLVTGYTTSSGNGGSDLLLLKVDEKGQLISKNTYGGSKNDSGKDLHLTSDGGYVIIGDTNSKGAGNSDAWLLKFNSKGILELDKTYGGNNLESTHAIRQAKDSSYLIAGETNSKGAGNTDLWFLKVNTNGNVELEKTFGGQNYEAAHSLVATNDGGVALVGYTSSKGSGNTDAWLVKLDNKGNKEYEQIFGGSYSDFAYSIVENDGGSFVLAGSTSSKGLGAGEAWIINTSKGNVVWDHVYGGIKEDGAFSVAATDDKGYVLAGYTGSKGSGSSDIWVIKLDENGKQCK